MFLLTVRENHRQIAQSLSESELEQYIDEIL